MIDKGISVKHNGER